MVFTYEGYRGLLDLLARQGYKACGYNDHAAAGRCVILRHDIDYEPKDAAALGELERDMGVSSTYFVLLSSGLYNPFAAENLSVFRALLAMGHQIGLHFDEKAYGHGFDAGLIVREILSEADILGRMLGTEIKAVSMHRPSPETLKADLAIPGIVNSYSREFFQGFKYLSDSRRRWREPAEEIIASGRFERLHILTHPFWYRDGEISLAQRLGSFIESGNAERYALMKDNITDLDSALKGE